MENNYLNLMCFLKKKKVYHLICKKKYSILVAEGTEEVT